VSLAPGNVYGSSNAWIADCAGQTDDCWSTGLITFGLRLLTAKDIRLTMGFVGVRKFCEMEFSNSSRSQSHHFNGCLVIAIAADWSAHTFAWWVGCFCCI
jgi:hypothetical protein